MTEGRVFIVFILGLLLCGCARNDGRTKAEIAHHTLRLVRVFQSVQFDAADGIGKTRSYQDGDEPRVIFEIYYAGGGQVASKPIADRKRSLVRFLGTALTAGEIAKFAEYDISVVEIRFSTGGSELERTSVSFDEVISRVMTHDF